MTVAGTIRIERRGTVRDLMRAYRIVVDGTEVGRVRRGETLDVAVTPGRHVVAARIDWTGSPDVEVTVAPGGTTRLVCEAEGALWRAAYQAFTRQGWLTLREVP